MLFTGVPTDVDNRIYQYDPPLGWTASIGTGTDTTFYGANVFSAERYEELTNVSFYTREPGG
ncbi:lectin like domain-containing protein [Methanogenium cariaci]|uniref:lectin like domain-containing protein n=1 Tax=Methanogenium cariaci TaxID=2197 RepID=UPI001FE1543B|nr:lectin like domain-containing protein [Methanogenium cariaci]